MAGRLQNSVGAQPSRLWGRWASCPPPPRKQAGRCSSESFLPSANLVILCALCVNQGLLFARIRWHAMEAKAQRARDLHGHHFADVPLFSVEVDDLVVRRAPRQPLGVRLAWTFAHNLLRATHLLLTFA